MLREEWDLSPQAEVDALRWLYRRGLIFEDADIGVPDPLGDGNPHALALHNNCAVLILPFDVEDEPCGLAAFEALASLDRWNPEGVWMLAVRLLRGSQLPKISLEARKPHDAA
jgi:hypothetical protein